MQSTLKINVVIIFTLVNLFVFLAARGDTIILVGGQTIEGKVIQKNNDHVLILKSYSAFNCNASIIKSINIGLTQTTDTPDDSRLPSFQKAIVFLSKQSWATNLTPIPATVIDKGILKNVPYVSFHCGIDYEVNIYGDLDQPAGIEIGIYHHLINDNFAKQNCLNFINGLLGQSADQAVLQGLNLNKDLKTKDNLTFEITPPDADDAYNGWWISVYSGQQLNDSRATDEEMKHISIQKKDITNATPEIANSSWSADELKLARTVPPETFTFTNNSGDIITNAKVIRVFVKGVSVIWQSDSKLGMARLSDLPESIRVRYDYDAAKTAAIDALAQAQKEKQRQEAQAALQAAQSAQAAAAAQPTDFLNNGPYDSGGEYSGGGTVYVHGYYRSNGTYVNAYTRSSPHSR